MYVFSTKLDTAKQGCSRFAGIIRFHLPDLPNSRSILRLQKNGTNAERGADENAELGAVGCAVVRADAFADEFIERCADCRAVIRADARAVVHAELRANSGCRKLCRNGEGAELVLTNSTLPHSPHVRLSCEVIAAAPYTSSAMA